MQYFSQLYYYFIDSFLLWTWIENLVIASCISSIIYFVSKNNKNISILINVPILFLLFLIRGQNYHLFFAFLSLISQFVVIFFVEKELKKPVSKK